MEMQLCENNPSQIQVLHFKCLHEHRNIFIKVSPVSVLAVSLYIILLDYYYWCGVFFNYAKINK